MIKIDPSDFSSDRFYTKMEELNGKKNALMPRLVALEKDVLAVEKYLKELNLLKDEYWLEGVDSTDLLKLDIGWNNKTKRLVSNFADLRTYTQSNRNLIECKIIDRLKYHAAIPKLIDVIIESVSEENE